MSESSISVRFELAGWELCWALLEVPSQGADLASLRASVTAAARQRFRDRGAIAADPVVSALRKLFKAAGCDPSRYRPSSEALLRRLVTGNELPAIQPLVDLNNCLSAECAVPCCVMAEASFGRQLVLRAGRGGEGYLSLRGPFSLTGKPALFDDEGPVDSPITGNERVKVEADTTRAWLVAYLPAAALSADQVWQSLDRLAGDAGITAGSRGVSR